MSNETESSESPTEATSLKHHTETTCENTINHFDLCCTQT